MKMENFIHDITRLNSERDFLNTLSCEDSKTLIKKLLEEKLAREKSIGKLSFNQESLWISNQTMVENAAYHVGFAVKIKGDFDLKIFENTFQQIVDRHDSLRTRFFMQDEHPMQQVKASEPVLMNQINATSWSKDYLNEQIIKTYKIPFNLMNDPVFRVYCFCSADENVLLLNFHHIAIDAYSLTLLVNELFEMYRVNSELLSFDKPIYNLENTYLHFTSRQNEKMLGEEGKRLKAYWLEKLSGELPVLNLPFNKPRPTRQTLNGASLFFSFQEEICAKLRQLARENNSTLYTTLLSIFQAYLNRISGQNDIIVGTPMSSGRLDQHYTNTIGYFVNLVPMRADFTNNANFTTFLQQNKKTVLEGIKHQAYPFSMLVNELGNQRDTGTTPIFQTLFNLLTIRSSDKFKALFMPNPESQPVEFDNLTLESINLPQTEGQFDIVLEMYEDDERIVGLWKYNTDLFTEHSMKRMVDNFKIFVAGILNNPQQLISHLPLLSENEINQLLNQDSTVYESDNSTLISLFEAQVLQTPEAIALVFGQEVLTYSALNEKANQLAHYLQQEGVGVGTLVSLCVARSMEMVISLLGILKSGGVYIPLDPTHPSERLAYFLADSQSNYLLTTQQSAQHLPSDYEGKTLYLDELTGILSCQSSENLGVELLGSDLAYIIYTSGSTGHPKGVMLAHAGVVNRIAWQWKHYHFTKEDVILQKTTYCFDVSVWEFFMTLCYGAKLVLCSAETVYNPWLLSELIASHGVTTLHFVPSMYRAFLSHLSAESLTHLSSLRHVLLSGEALSPDLVGEHYKHVRIPMHNLYGPTEASVDVSYYEVQPIDSQSISVPIGKAIANTQLYILDQYQQLVPPGITGELYLGGIGLAKGYLNRAELTAERFIENPFNVNAEKNSAKLYRTGDLARWDEEGNIVYLGRIDFQVKVRGYRIELGEIEHQLQQHEGIQQVVVLAPLDQEQNQYLVAYVAMNEGEEMPKSSELRAYLRQTLPDYMLPEHYVLVAAWTLNSNGKLDRNSLTNLHLPISSPESAGDLMVSQTALSKGLVSIWAEVLGQDLGSVNMRSHFFEMGGHSLKALRLVSRIHQRLGISLGVDVVFMNPMFGDLLKVLEEAKVDNYRAIGLISNPENQYDLSNSQRRLWVLDQMGAGASYHIFSSFQVVGSLEKSSLSQALNYIIARHEILRTRFVVINGIVQQRVLTVEECNFEIALKTIIATNEKVFIDDYISKPFDLSQDNLLRVCLLEQPCGETKLIFVMHHIISDGWSLDVFIQELCQCYEQLLNGQNPDLPSLRIQYKDYALWSNNRLLDAWAMQAKSYWQEIFKGDLPVLNLPTAHRPLTKTYQGGVVNRVIPKDLFTKFTRTEGQNVASNFIKLQAIVGILLHRYTGQDDFVIGTPVAGRGEAELDAQIGFYVNLLALRSRVEASESYLTLLERMRVNTVEAYGYQDYPFDQLIEDLPLSRDTSRNALFDVLLNYQHFTDKSSIILGDAVLSESPCETITCKYDLEFSCQETPAGLGILLNYNTDIFTPKSMEQMLCHLENIMRKVVENPTEKIGALAYLGNEEIHQLTEFFNQTQRTYDTQETLVSMFENQVSKTPDAVALTSHNEILTYQELNKRANHIAYYLRNEKGIYPEQVIALLADRGWELVVGILGIWKSGGVYLPLDTNHPAERLAYLLEDSKAKLVLSQGNFAEILTTFNTQNYVLVEDILNDAQDDIGNNNWLHSSQHLAYLLYTSGSTGKPKGVLIRHQNVCNFLHSMSEYLLINKTDKWASINNYAFDIFMLELMLPLTQGAEVLMVSHEIIRSPHELRQLLTHEKVTFLQATPTMWGLILEDNFTYLKNITALCGGEPMGEYLGKKLLKSTKKLWNVYGPTETTIWSTIKLIEDETDLGSIGKPIANTQIYILDNQQNLVPAGVVGEICIGGNGLARGYLNRDDLTAEKFFPNPYVKTGRVYRTGDLGRWLPNGELECLGRTDNQVKIRGYRIELSEIEHILEQHPAIAQSAVLVHNDASNSKILVAYLRSEQDLASPEMREFAKEFLPDYMVPSHFVCLREFPKTPNGKLDKKQMPQPNFSQSIQRNIYEKPQNWEEEMLASIWEVVLNKQQVGRNDNFFDIGGDSLKAIQVVSRVYEAGYKITVMALFNNPILKNVAALLTETEKSQMEISAWAKAKKAKKKPMNNSYLDTYSNTKIEFGQGNDLSFQYTLSAYETEQLFEQINKTYTTETADILLTVLGLSVNEIFDNQQVMVDVVVEEETLLANSGSSQNHHFPLLLTTNYSHQWARQIKETKEQIRQVLSEGVPTGIENITPQIVFRYGHNLERTAMDYTPEIMLEISNTDNYLEIKFHFSDCNAQKAFAFQENYVLILKEIITFCTQQNTQELSPSDLGYSQLSVDELENFFN